MTVRASRFPECQLWEYQQQRIERSQQPEIHKELCKCLIRENEERMRRYWDRFLKTRDWEQYKKDMDKQQEFMLMKMRTVL
jgi:hypothetical protein